MLDTNFTLSILAVLLMTLFGVLVVREAAIGGAAERAIIESAANLETARTTEQIVRASEERFRTLAQAMPVGVYQTDSSGRMDFVNGRLSRIFGLPAAKLLGDAWMDSLAEVEAFRGESAWEGFREKGDRKEYEFEYKREDGERVWIRSVRSAIFDEKGEITGFVGAALDVTEHRRTLDQLADSQRRIQSLANLAPVGIFRADLDGMCTDANDAMLELAGLTVEEATGPRWPKVLHPDDRDHVMEQWHAAVSARGPFQARYRFRHRDGSSRSVLCNAVPEFDDAGVVVGYVGVVLKIGEVVDLATGKKQPPEEFDQGVLTVI